MMMMDYGLWKLRCRNMNMNYHIIYLSKPVYGAKHFSKNVNLRVRTNVCVLELLNKKCFLLLV